MSPPEIGQGKSLALCQPSEGRQAGTIGSLLHYEGRNGYFLPHSNVVA